MAFRAFWTQVFSHSTELKPMGRWKYFVVGAVLLITPLLATAEEEAPEQDFLFLNEEAYVQEWGEWQIDLTFSFAGGMTSEFEGEEGEDIEGTIDLSQSEFGLAVEYGITENLQLEFELSWLSSEADLSLEDADDAPEFDPDSEGWSDAELALAYRLIEESEALPTITLGLELSVPIGSSELTSDAWGFGPFLSLSKELGELGFIHANLGYEVMNGVEEGDEAVDERELVYGIAYAYPLFDDGFLLLELAGSREKETSEDASETVDLLYIAPGLVFEVSELVSLGASVGAGLTDESFDWIAAIRASWEF